MLTGSRAAPILVLVLLLTLARPAAASPRPGGSPAGAPPPYVPGEVIVKFRAGSPRFPAAGEDGALRIAWARDLPYGATLLRTDDVQEALAALRGNPCVEYAQPNYVYRLAATSDPLWPQQWGMADEILGVRAEAAWRYTEGSSAVTVAVVDSGVDPEHPDLAGRLARGYDFVNEDGDPADDHGHGTHVAGIIAAAAGNGIGIAGAAPGVKILPLKAADAAGRLTTADIVEAIEYAAAHGARVINMSFGTVPNPAEPLAFFDHLLYRAIKSHPDIIFVAAAGNEHNDNDALPVFPAGFARENVVDGVRYPALRNVTAVAALGRDGGLAGFSNWGRHSVLLAAPGEEVASTVPVREEAGVALAVYDDSAYGYRAVLWGFGAEDLDEPFPGASTAGAVYDAVVRAVSGYLGITPAETAARPLLLVDDDQSGLYPGGELPDVRSYYLEPLNEAGCRVAVCEVVGGDGPSVSAAVYAGVIWFTGHASDGDPRTPEFDPNLTPADQRNLTAYLRQGGRLFLSGRDACLGIEKSELCARYLDVSFGGETYASRCAARGVGAPYLGAYYLFRIPNAYFDRLAPGLGGTAAVALKLEPYEAWSGTSAAAAFVSAGAALALSLDRSLSPVQVREALASGVTALEALRSKTVSGGTLNLAGALRFVRGRHRDGGGAAPPEKEELPPATGMVTLTGEAQRAAILDGMVTLAVPAGAFPAGAKVTVRLAADAPANPPAEAVPVSPVISLESEVQPKKPVSIAIRFDRQKLGGLDPLACLVFREEGGTWLPVGGKLDRGAGAIEVALERFSSYAVFAVRKEFGDVPGHWAAREIGVLAARGVLGGYPDGSFRPDKTVTRAELASLLAKFLDLKAEGPANAFSDVPPDAWYAPAVAAVKAKGLMAGAKGQFRPNATLTREELAAVVLRLAGLKEQDLTVSFRDAQEVAPWARRAVATAAAAGLMRGVGEDRFAPKDEVTRAQAAAILCRVAERLGLYAELVTVTGRLVWSTIEKPHWGLATDKETYVLLPDPADRLTSQFLRANEGKTVAVTGYPETGPNIYMRGPILRVVAVAAAQQ